MCHGVSAAGVRNAYDAFKKKEQYIQRVTDHGQPGPVDSDTFSLVGTWDAWSYDSVIIGVSLKLLQLLSFVPLWLWLVDYDLSSARPLLAQWTFDKQFLWK